LEGWTGDGSQGSPFFIEGYDLSNSTNAIEIKDTDVFFTITGNLLQGTDYPWYGISLSNVSNGNITQNTIKLYKVGIFMYKAKNITISDNTITSNRLSGLWIKSSENNVISGNQVSGNSVGYGDTYGGAEVCGIYLLDSNDNTISSNTIQNNKWDGLNLPRSSNNIISNNIISNHLTTGIDMSSELGQDNFLPTTGSNNIISHNLIYLNTFGIFFRGSNNVISDNSIYENTIGIYLGVYNYRPVKTNPDTYTVKATNTEIENNIVNNNTVGILLENSEDADLDNNSIYFNSAFGVILNVSSSDNSIVNNDFVANNLDESTNTQSCQAFDNGSTNTFNNNYWYEWTSPDSDEDGIVDKAYSITGEPENNDPSPKVSPNNPNSPTDVIPPPPKSSSGWTLLISTISIILVTKFRRGK
ncbi:MAG: right-handed parallel beta-helix repeat-containing protein, partial [Candidatus Kariarchaeaceae archaeon]